MQPNRQGPYRSYGHRHGHRHGPQGDVDPEVRARAERRALQGLEHLFDKHRAIDVAVSPPKAEDIFAQPEAPPDPGMLATYSSV